MRYAKIANSVIILTRVLVSSPSDSLIQTYPVDISQISQVIGLIMEVKSGQLMDWKG